MKSKLCMAALSVVLTAPLVHADSETDALRARCAEQERQIKHLEQENSKLRSDTPTSKLSSKPIAEAAAAAESPKANRAEVASYTVKAGDSIEKIARKLGTTPAKLANANGFKPSALIHPGQKLKHPAIAEKSTKAEPPASATSSGRSYKIREGDTFESVAKKYKLTTAQLVAFNPKIKASELRLGQSIQLEGDETPAPKHTAGQPKPPTPAPKEVVAKESTPKQPATAPVDGPKPSISAPAKTPPDAPAAAAEKKIRPVTIDGEMTYGEFAAKHGTNTERLNALNGLELTQSTVLAKGSELYVPAQP